MRGEIVAIWQETWAAIWLPLAENEASNDDLFCELYRAAAEAKALRVTPSQEELADFIDDPAQSMEAFKSLTATDFAGEFGVVLFLEAAFDVFEEQGGDALSNSYFQLLESFIAKYSLRYDLRRPCQLCPTLPGIFTGLIRELRAITSQDAHLDSLMRDFENALRDLKSDDNDGRIKTLIQKQVNLIEAISRQSPGVTQATLGAICNELTCWPHEKLRESIKNLYAFASDYPGIRHGGTPANAIRLIEMRDLVAVSVLLAGFTPYLSHQLNANHIYHGGNVT